MLRYFGDLTRLLYVGILLYTSITGISIMFKNKTLTTACLAYRRLQIPRAFLRCFLLHSLSPATFTVYFSVITHNDRLHNIYLFSYTESYYVIFVCVILTVRGPSLSHKSSVFEHGTRGGETVTINDHSYRYNRISIWILFFRNEPDS